MVVLRQNRSRRDFLRLLGQGAAIYGVGSMGLLSRSWAQSKVPADLHLADGPEWEFYKPGVYDEDDQKIINAFQTELDKIDSRGKVSFADLTSGKFQFSQPGGGNVRGVISHQEAMKVVDNFGGRNPLFTDAEYAKKTKYGKPIVPPVVGVDEYMPPMPAGIGDYMVVSHWNGTTNIYRPVYEGDTLYSVIDQQHYRDITPAAGSSYRTFVLSGTGRCFNQRGELVSEGANIVSESFRRHKDKAKRNKGGIRAWESPDWWHQRPVYQYTNKDWDTIIAMWKAEKRRGSENLYWDDVKVGDQPWPLTNSPILTDVTTNMMFTMPQWATDTKTNVLNPEIFKTMVKNDQGIYVPPAHRVKKEDTEVHPGMEDMPKEYANRDGRSVVQNSFCAKWAAIMLYNWIGDNGWIERMGWDIMAKPPGYPESVIPLIPKQDYPELFDQRPYLDKVPFMKGKCAETHPLEGDIITNRGYVTGKYQKGNDYFVNLVWWCETFDKYVVQEGFATVKLPKRV
jgi:acyl dehydratase